MSSRPSIDPQQTDAETAELWPRICAGDDAALEELRSLIQEECPRLLLTHGAPRDALPELLGDVLSSVWEFARNSLDSASGHRAPKQIRLFLKWRARGVLTEHRRRGQELSSRAQVDQELPAPVRDTVPIHRALTEEVFDAYEACLEAMPENHRQIWKARQVRGLSTTEVAAELGITKGAVAMRLFHATSWLMNCLRSKGAIS